MSQGGRVNPVINIISPTLITLFLFTLVFYVPLIGIFLGLLSPLPIVYTYLQRGEKAGFLTLISVFILLFLLIGVRYGLIFLVEYGIVACVISESIKRDFSIEKTILFCVLGTLASGAFILLVYVLIEAKNPFAFLAEQMKANIDQSLEIYKEFGQSKGKSAEDLTASFERLKNIFIYSFPALIVIGSTIGSLLNYIIARHLWIKYIVKDDSKKRSLLDWSLPDYYVWVFIAAAFMMFLPVDFIRKAGVNLLLVMALVYFFQGLAITFFLFKKAKVPQVLQWIISLFILLQPLFAIVVSAMGLFDIWIDFRKIRKNRNQTS